MEEQVERAIEAAYDPRSDQNLKAQAFDFLNQLRSQREGWSICLSLALRESAPRSEVVRHVCLDVLNNAVKTGQLAEEDLRAVSSAAFGYVERGYGRGAGGSYALDSPSIQNKLTQTLTVLFTVMYERLWPDFFRDMLKLATLASTSGPPTSPVGDGSGSPNGPGTVMYLKILISIHDEIADVMLAKLPEEQKVDMKLKDLIRERDVRMIAASWHDLLVQWKGSEDAIVELCLNAIGRWVSWIDISLVVNDALLTLLFDLLSPHATGDQAVKLQSKRQAAIDTFVEILAKKMSPSDKLELIDVLKINEAVSQLVNGSSLSQLRHTPDYDTDLAEDVAKLVNNVVFDIVKALDSAKPGDALTHRGNAPLKSFLPHVLRFLSDEYDEICSSVVPCLTDFLNLMRKKAKANDPLASENAFMLPLILDVIIGKLKYDDTAVWGSEDTQTDEAEFQELRKRLHVLQQAIAAVDESMYIEKIMTVVLNTFDAYKSAAGQMHWRDLELALNQLFLFGELASKGGGIYSKTKPASPAAERLITMMYRLMDADVASSSHPAILLEYMEICVRYYMFFEANPQFITRVLENFVSFVHYDHQKVRLRSWYLLFRFVKHVRLHVGNIAETIIRALADLLPIKVDAVEDEDDAGDDMSSSDNGQKANARFTSQLYLYETIGCVCAVKAVPVENQVALIRSVMDPLFSELESNLAVAAQDNKQARTLVHHLIMALGTLARGFSDWTPAYTSSGSNAPPHQLVSEEFSRSAEATLVALEQLKDASEIREAARFAFSRYIGVLGSRILAQLPRWISGLLTQDSSRDEMALFMRLLDQVVFGFKTEIYDILNTLLTPFLQRVFAGIGEAATGTDDEIQLAELKREYLAFLSVILNNDLEAVLVSELNQPIFGPVISTIEHLARDVSDYPTGKLAISVLNRMVSTWGGPDVVPDQQHTNTPSRGRPGMPNGVANSSKPSISPTDTPSTKTKLEGFDHFMIARFSPLCWSIPSDPAFDAKDAQGRILLGECAALQKVIYAKTGQEYIDYLRNVELVGVGMQGSAVDEYLSALRGLDLKAFQSYFKNLVSRGGR